MKRYVQNQKGLSLLQVLLALTLLFFVLGGGWMIMAQGAKQLDIQKKSSDNRYTQKYTYNGDSELDGVEYELKDDPETVPCIIFDGNTQWSEVLKALGISNPQHEKIPANTTILIKGNLYLEQSNSNFGKRMFGVSEDSVKIYVEGHFFDANGGKISGVSVYVKGDFNHTNGGHVESSATVYVQGNHYKKNGSQGTQHVKSIETYESPNCVSDACEPTESYTFPKLPTKKEHTENFNNVKLLEGMLSIQLTKLHKNKDEYRILINANNYNNRDLTIYIILEDGRKVQIPKSINTSNQYFLDKFTGTPKSIYIEDC